MSDVLVVSRQTVDAGLDKDQSELGIFILTITLEMLADGHGLEIVRNL